MNLFRSRLAERPDLAARGGAADDGVVHHDHAFILDHLLDDGQFERDFELAELLAGGNEGPADVVASDHSHVERNLALLAVANRRGGAGVRNGNDNVRFDRVLSGQLMTELLAELVHVLSEDPRILLGEVDVLEDAVCGFDAAWFHEESAVQPVLVQPDDLTRLDLADELGPDGVDRAAFARDDPTALVGPADAQGPNPIGVARRLDMIGEQEKQRIRALKMVQDVAQRVGLALVTRLGQEMHDDLRVVGGFEDAAVGFVFVPEQAGVDQVAVVGHRHLPTRVLGQQWLAVLHLGRSARGISDVTDGDRVLQLRQGLRAAAEDPRNGAHPLVALDGFPVAGGDSRRLLPTMLEGVQTEIGLLHGVGVAEDPEQAALLPLLWKDLVRITI